MVFAIEGKDHWAFQDFARELGRQNGHPHPNTRIRSKIEAASRHPSMAAAIASYWSLDSASDTVFPFSFLVHW